MEPLLIQRRLQDAIHVVAAGIEGSATDK